MSISKRSTGELLSKYNWINIDKILEIIRKLVKRKKIPVRE